jgi:hypothetical protein
MSPEGSIWFEDEGDSITVRGKSEFATFSVKSGLKWIFGFRFDFNEEEKAKRVWRISKLKWDEFDEVFRAMHLPTLGQYADAAHSKRVKDKEADAALLKRVKEELEGPKEIEGDKRKREPEGEEMVKLSKLVD